MRLISRYGATHGHYSPESAIYTGDDRTYWMLERQWFLPGFSTCLLILVFRSLGLRPTPAGARMISPDHVQDVRIALPASCWDMAAERWEQIVHDPRPVLLRAVL